jgi:rubrerythrin
MTTRSTTGAAELAGVEVRGMSRSAFLVRGALAAGAVYGLGAVRPFVTHAAMQMDGGDVEIVNFALTLEYLETDFYGQALKLGLSNDVKPLARLIHEDEAQHVDALVATVKQLGGNPAAKPAFSFPMKDEKSFLELAQTLEDTGVSAYNGAAPSIESAEVLGAAGTIVQVEARHAAAIRIKNGASPAPDAFDKPLAAKQVLSAVKPFIG